MSSCKFWKLLASAEAINSRRGTPEQITQSIGA